MERNPFENKNKASHSPKSHRFSSYSKNYRTGIQSSDNRGIVNRNETALTEDRSMSSTSVIQDLSKTPNKTVPPPVATISPRIKIR